MKKLVCFSHGLSANGIETFLVNVLKNINRTKYEITVIIAIDEGVECLHEKTVSDLGIEVIHAGDLDSPKKKVAYIKKVNRILSSRQFDIAHANMDLLNGITLTLAKLHGIPKRICHAHTSKSQYVPSGRLALIKKTVQKIYYRVMKALMVHCSTDYLSCSEDASKYFYGNKKSEFIYNGIDIESLKEQVGFDKKSYISALVGDVNCGHIIVSIGRLSPVKNPRFAVDTIVELAKIRSDFKYIWVGSGELEAEMKQLVSELGISDKVIFVGVRTDVREIPVCSDCFLMTSLFEGLPFSLIEAQASGLPCVVSDAVTSAADLGLVEYISLDSGAEEWARLIDKKIDAPKKQVDENKLARFDIRNTVNQLEIIYDR